MHMWLGLLSVVHPYHRNVTCFWRRR